MSSSISKPLNHNQTITAVLGPTNTGKTHYALERMWGYSSGIFGLPLRLLAREIYDKTVAVKGKELVALITGEERIIPKNPCYWIATVESMPLDIQAHFVAVDEIQLCSDRDRGHIFTDRMLHARGIYETVFLGADTIAPLLKELIPEVKIIKRPRLSQLSYISPRKLTRLPPRTAIVAFTASDVYAIAETIRRQKNGVAVVMGSLSPRTRNAQVALYQNGQVDYLVATDAIGMGLNMDIDHVAFASLEKFDGEQYRYLRTDEIAQIAGRAGRYMTSGTFSVISGQEDYLDGRMVKCIEDGLFDPLRHIWWRNSNLCFDSIPDLLQSLEQKSANPLLWKSKRQIDLECLYALSDDSQIEPYLTNKEKIKQLWEVCQIPDFRNIHINNHIRLLIRIFLHLQSIKNKIPEDWLSGHIDRLFDTTGDIENLSNRLAYIRTWTYIAYRAHWLNDAAYWQEKTRTIEDCLSDALHERLTQRFVNRRMTILLQKMRVKEEFMSDISEQGDVTVEGERIGHIEGLTFIPVSTETSGDRKVILETASRVLSEELEKRVMTLIEAGDAALRLGDSGEILWGGAKIAEIQMTHDVFSPQIILQADDALDNLSRVRFGLHVESWVKRHLQTVLQPLVALKEADLEGFVKGFAFQIVENWGYLERAKFADQITQLSQEDRAKLRTLGVRFAEYAVYMRDLLKPAPTRAKIVLWALKEGIKPVPTPPPAGVMAVPYDEALSDEYYRVGGYRVCGNLAVRADMVEKLADSIRPLTQKTAENPNGEFEITAQMMSFIGRSGDDFASVLRSLGFHDRKVALTEVSESVQDSPVSSDSEEANPEAKEQKPVPTEKVLWSRRSFKRPAPKNNTSSDQKQNDGGRRKHFSKPHQNNGEERGFKPRPKNDGKKFEKPSGNPRPQRPSKPIDENSPFAILANLQGKIK